MMRFNRMTRDERIAGFAARNTPEAGTYHQTLQECDLCGLLEWISSTPAPEPSVSVERMEIGRCPCCASVKARSPEVFNWVLCVLAQHDG